MILRSMQYPDVLALAFRQGEAQAFSEIHRRFRSPILSFLTYRLGSAQNAEEVTQEVFLKAFRFRSSYDPRYPLSAWLWTITRNTLTDWQRRSVENRGGSCAEHSEIDEIASEALSAEELVASKDEKRRLRKILRQLPRLQRRVITMRYLRLVPYQEIATRLGVSLSAAKCAAYRARMTILPLVMSGAVG